MLSWPPLISSGVSGTAVLAGTVAQDGSSDDAAGSWADASEAAATTAAVNTTIRCMTLSLLFGGSRVFQFSDPLAGVFKMFAFFKLGDEAFVIGERFGRPPPFDQALAQIEEHGVAARE